MSDAEKLIIVAVFLWVALLLWRDRPNGPKKCRDQARWNYLLTEAIRDKREG